MRPVTVAATQMACSDDSDANVDVAAELVRSAAGQGAQIVLLQELFATPYFCRTQRGEHFDLAKEFARSSDIARFSALADELGVVLPISLLRAGGADPLQLDRDHRCRRRRARRLPQVAHPGRTRIPGEVLLLARRHRASCLGHALRPDRRRHLLGPVVPGSWRGRWPARRRAAVVLRRDGSEPPDPELDSSRHWQRRRRNGGGQRTVGERIWSKAFTVTKIVKQPDKQGEGGVVKAKPS